MLVFCRLTGMVLLMAIAGCSTMTVNSVYDPFASFPKAGTYAWMPGSQQLPDDPRVDRADVDRRIRSAVERRLAAKGFTPASQDKADILIAYHAALESRLDAAAVNKNYHSWGYGPDGSWGYGPDRKVSLGQDAGPVYEKGSIVLDIVDPGTKRLLWRGSAEAHIVVAVSTEEKERRTDEAVQAILARFPPKK